MTTEDKAADAIKEIDIILKKAEKELPPHVFDAVLSYVKSKFMKGL